LQSRPSDHEAKRGLALAYERAENYAGSLQMLSQVPAEPNALTADLMVRCLDLLGLKRLPEASAAAKHLGERPDFEFADLTAMNRLLDAPAAAVPMAILCESLDARGKLALEGLRLLAIAYENTNRLSDARKTLERAAAQEPTNPAHLLELARVAEKQKDHEGALGYLGHARELTQNDPQVHYLFGMIAAEMDLPIEARRSFEKALELAPANPVYNYAMGTVILSTRDAATAAGYFEKYVSAKPGEPRGRYALGVAEFASGDYVKAKENMLGLEQDASVAGSAEYFLGRMARLDGDFDGAKQHLAKAIRLLPAFAESHTELARVWMLEDKQAEGLTELQRALKLDPNSFQANAQLLAIYKKTHDKRAETQSEFLKKLDEDRSRRAELMLRTVEIRP
jgi:tetratricopeptide (TPR) repeat protein